MWIGGTAVMANKPSNDAVLRQLKNGIAQFELVSSPVPSISTSSISQVDPTALFGGYSHRFFARTPNFTSSFDRGRSSVPNSVQSVTCDGRCLFRALAKGMAANKGYSLGEGEERRKAAELKNTVKQVICENGQERPEYKEAVAAIRDNGSLKSYCKRIDTPKFRGGESELLVLSQSLGQPIVVYEHEHTNGGMGSGRYIPIAEYGREFGGGFGPSGNHMKAVRLLKLEYSGRNHYDLLPIA